jgi:glycerol-3-phosphate dehydrogenase (NAD(P)+)
MQITVLGAGSWGTAMALVLAQNGHQVRLLARSAEQVEAIQSERANSRYLPGFTFPPSLNASLMEGAEPWGDLLVEALPSGAVESRLDDMEGYPMICVATKGLERHGGLFTTMIQERHPRSEVCLISGPNLAKELAGGIPTAAVVACLHEEVGLKVREAFHSPTFRVYFSEDVIGVEVAGALKNVMALAAGMSDGLGFGDNTKGTLLSRGLAEMARLGRAMGANLETFLGIAGVGDLFATATSRLSRNYRAGRLLSQGASVEEALKELGQVAEGIPTCEAGVILARKLNVQAPIMENVYLVTQGQVTAREVVGRLMERVTLRENIGDVFSPDAPKEP